MAIFCRFDLNDNIRQNMEIYMKPIKCSLKNKRIAALCTKNEDFHQTYLNTGSNTQNVEGLSQDLIFYNIFGKILKVLVTKLQVMNFL